MSRWLVATSVAPGSSVTVSTPVFKVTDAVAAQIKADVEAGAVGKKTYAVEAYPGAEGGGEAGGNILIDVDNVVLIRAYDASPI